LRQSEKRLIWTTRLTEVLPGVFVTGEIPRINDFEDTGGRFFWDAGCTRPDPLLDDQALYFDRQSGLVVILGCAHSGVVNTLTYIRGVTGGRPLHAIIWGMHLLAAEPSRMQATIDAFRHWAPKRIFPAHFTGVAASSEFWRAFPGCVSICPSGTRLVL